MGTVIDSGQPWAVPVTVNVVDTAGAPGSTLRVNLEDEPVEVGEKDPLTPSGRSETLSATFEANPESRCTVIVTPAEDPAASDTVSDGPDREKPRTTTVSVSESEAPPPAPVTVKLSEPRAASQLLATVSLEVQSEEVTRSESNDPVRPGPRFETLSVTFEVKPGSGSTSTS